jgi:hypothetical protein
VEEKVSFLTRTSEALQQEIRELKSALSGMEDTEAGRRQVEDADVRYAKRINDFEHDLDSVYCDL